MSNEKFKVKFGLAVGDTNATAGLGQTGSLQINGAQTGSSTFVVPDNGSTIAYTLPGTAPAVNGYVLSATTAGAMSWVAQSGGGAVSSVTGGTHVTASPTTGAVVVSTDATNLNTASTIVARDASGNFSAGTITANLTGNASGTAANVTGTVAVANGGTGQISRR